MLEGLARVIKALLTSVAQKLRRFEDRGGEGQASGAVGVELSVAVARRRSMAGI
jgi:hypothetical protein